VLVWWHAERSKEEVVILLHAEGLTKYFGGLAAVEDLDFDVTKGEIVGLIGPNGAGKTTVFNLLTGFERPTGGKVMFKGHDITGWKPSRIAALGLTRTFQIVNVFRNQTTYENVRLGHYLQQRNGGFRSIFRTRSARREEGELQHRTIELLERVGLIDVKDELASSLSQGLQRALGICIALASSPDLLLMDEPTAGMSAEETANIMAIIRQMRDMGVTIVLVEHDVKMAMGCSDRIVVLNFGKKIAEGTPEEIAGNEEVIEAYLGVRRSE